jgi:hypothetical protein
VFFRYASVFAFALLPLNQARATGLSQSDEATPYDGHIPTLADQHPWRLATGIVFGSNFVAYSGGMNTKEGNGRVGFTNWVNNGEFAHANLDESWTYKGALVQRTSWISVHGDEPFPSYVGLTSVWIDNTFRHQEKGSPWAQAIVLSPGVSSDFADFRSQAFRLPVQASVRYAFSGKFSLELGVNYSPDFVQTPVTPLPGFNWNPTEDWEIRYRFTTLNIIRRLAPEVTLGVFASYQSASWEVGKNDNPGQVAYSAATAGVEFVHGFHITDTLPGAVHLAIGGTFAGAVCEYDGDGSDRRDSLQLDSGYFARIGLVIRF